MRDALVTTDKRKVSCAFGPRQSALLGLGAASTAPWLVAGLRVAPLWLITLSCLFDGGLLLVLTALTLGVLVASTFLYLEYGDRAALRASFGLDREMTMAQMAWARKGALGLAVLSLACIMMRLLMGFWPTVALATMALLVAAAEDQGQTRRRASRTRRRAAGRQRRGRRRMRRSRR